MDCEEARPFGSNRLGVSLSSRFNDHSRVSDEVRVLVLGWIAVECSR